MSTSEIKFLATPDKGEVSALLMLPPNTEILLVLGHGASSNMHTPLLQSIAEALAEQKVATFRYNFPYSEKGGGRNSQATCTATIRSAVAAAQQAAPDLPLFAGGHSFSGRMTSIAQSEQPLDGVRGLIFFAFPLHPAGKRGTDRAAHLDNVNIPMLFLSGTRDALAERDLLEPTIAKLPNATLHLLDTADHSFKTLKRTRTSPEDVFSEAARVAFLWANA
ncbi:MAG: alpha/beta hydrolase, partial [Blastocatellia bacterium]|nr:alpha/beta hydrolase [Blastocatellia bacterium]